MKFIFIFLFNLFAFIVRDFHLPQTQIKNKTGVTVLELFTSQGCSSCPSADKLVNQTFINSKVNGKQIIVLAFHVDYWNHLGWKDPYSKKEWTQRQYQYNEWFKKDGAYTPQLVVNGTDEFVGSNKKLLEESITKFSTSTNFISFKTIQFTLNGKKVNVKSSLIGKIGNSKIYAVLIAKHTENSIPRGENAGKKLEGNNVVREMIELKNSNDLNFSLNIPEDLNTDNAAMVLFAQDNKTHQIIGAELVYLK